MANASTFPDPSFTSDDAESRREANQRLTAFTFGFAFRLGVQVVFLVLWTLFGHTDTGLLSVPVAASSTMAAGVAGAGALRRLQVLGRVGTGRSLECDESRLERRTVRGKS